MNSLHPWTIGDIIGVVGKVFRTRRGEISVEIDEFVLLCKALRPLPEKWHGLVDVDLRYRHRYLDLIVNPDVRRVFLQRTAVLKAVRKFLDSRGYIEVETSSLHSLPEARAQGRLLLTITPLILIFICGSLSSFI